MVLEFLGPKPWDRITETARMVGPRHAAIAYIGSGARDLLPLKAGDILVVNAARGNLRSHITSPYELEWFVKQDVRVYNDTVLHAKVLAVRSRAVIGSANASRNSKWNVDEASLVTNDRAVISAVRNFVIDLANRSQELDLATIKLMQHEWDQGTEMSVPGISRPRAEDLPTTGVMHFEWTEPTNRYVPDLPTDLASEVPSDFEATSIDYSARFPTGWHSGDQLLILHRGWFSLWTVIAADMPYGQRLATWLRKPRGRKAQRPAALHGAFTTASLPTIDYAVDEVIGVERQRVILDLFDPPNA